MNNIPSMIKTMDGEYINGDIVELFCICDKQSGLGTFEGFRIVAYMPTYDNEMISRYFIAEFETREEAQEFLDWLADSIGTVTGYQTYINKRDAEEFGRKTRQITRSKR